MNERQAVKWIARFVPWLAPLPSAWLVGRAVLSHLAFPLPVAIVTALVIEALGLVSVFNWQSFSDWNRRKLKTDTPAAPWQPAALGALYLVLTIGLIVFLEIATNGFTWSVVIYGIFPLLGLVGTANLALFAGQENREAAAEAAKVERKRKRQEGKAEAAARKRKPPATRKRKPEAATASGNGNRQAAMDLIAAMPDISGAELGRQLGLSERQGRNLRAELLPDIGGNGKDPAQA